MKIAVAGTGYVGLSIATLLSQHHEVMAVDIIPGKVDLINHKKSPIQDEYIEKYLAEKNLNLTATLDAETQIGAGLYFGHAYCITINPKAILGGNINIHKGVTIGQENRGKRMGTPVILSLIHI